MMFLQRSIAIFSVAIVLTGGASAQTQTNPCVKVYNSSVHNVEIETRERSARSFYFNLYCEESGEAKSFTHSGAFGLPIEGIPAEVNGDWTWDENDLKKFCEIGSKQNYSHGSDFGYGRYVVTDALDSFNQCIALTRKNVTVTHEEAPPDRFMVTIDVDENSFTTLDAVEYFSNEMTCTSTNLGKEEEDRGRIVVDGDLGYRIETTVNIACERTPIDTADGGKYYPRVTFQLATADGPYTVILKANKHFGFDTAAQAEAAHAEAIAMYNQAVEEKEALFERLSCSRYRLNQIKNKLPVAWEEWKRIAGTWKNHDARNSYIREFMTSKEPSPLDLKITKKALDDIVAAGRDC